jgi:hypothetical protein
MTREAHAIELDAEAEAAELRRRGLARIPAIVAAVVACVTEESP